MVVNLRRRRRNKYAVDAIERLVAWHVTLDFFENAVEQITVSLVDFMNAEQVEPHSAVRDRFHHLAP